MSSVERFRCGGCGTEYKIEASERPTVVCRNCDRIATRHGDEAALREYRLGYTKYREARRRLTAGLETLEAGKTTLARGELNDAAAEFETSVEHLRSADREADSDVLADAAAGARRKATCFWRAVEWLSGFTYAREQGATTRAATFRHDANRRLQTASDYDEPTAPDRLRSALDR